MSMIALLTPLARGLTSLAMLADFQMQIPEDATAFGVDDLAFDRMQVESSLRDEGFFVGRAFRGMNRHGYLREPLRGSEKVAGRLLHGIARTDTECDFEINLLIELFASELVFDLLRADPAGRDSALPTAIQY